MSGGTSHGVSPLRGGNCSSMRTKKGCSPQRDSSCAVPGDCHGRDVGPDAGEFAKTRQAGNTPSGVPATGVAPVSWNLLPDVVTWALCPPTHHSLARRNIAGQPAFNGAGQFIVSER